MFKRFNWTDVSIIMDRDDVHGSTVGETIDFGLQVDGYYPHVFKYYGDIEKNLTRILEEASKLSRGNVQIRKG